MDATIVIDTTDYRSRRVVLYQTTVDAKAKSHLDRSGNITYEEVKECVGDPDLVCVTAKVDDHPDRLVYYRMGDLSGGAPPYRRVVVDYSSSPAFIVSWHRARSVGGYSDIEFGPRKR
ncbi:MAG: hypothetical protein Q7V61_05660 [Actinomycetota bacterium]|nr:hypothetical protein [Actinomycetota bacterium]